MKLLFAAVVVLGVMGPASGGRRSSRDRVISPDRDRHLRGRDRYHEGRDRYLRGRDSYLMGRGRYLLGRDYLQGRGLYLLGRDNLLGRGRNLLGRDNLQGRDRGLLHYTTCGLFGSFCRTGTECPTELSDPRFVGIQCPSGQVCCAHKTRCADVGGTCHDMPCPSDLQGTPLPAGACPTGQTCCVRNVECRATMDLVIGLDASNSKSDFTAVKQYVQKELLPAFNVNENGVRVAVMAYGNNVVKTVCGLADTATDLSAKQACMGNAARIGGRKHAAPFITAANDELLTNGRAGVPKMVVLLFSDIDDDQQTLTAKFQAEADGIIIVAVGISKKSTTLADASLAATGQRLNPFLPNVFALRRVKLLRASVTKQLTDRLCTPSQFLPKLTACGSDPKARCLPAAGRKNCPAGFESAGFSCNCIIDEEKCCKPATRRKVCQLQTVKDQEVDLYASLRAIPPGTQTKDPEDCNKQCLANAQCVGSSLVNGSKSVGNGNTVGIVTCGLFSRFVLRKTSHPPTLTKQVSKCHFLD